MDASLPAFQRVIRRLILAGCLLFAQVTLYAQEVTEKDGVEITFQAKRLVGEFENYLNTISNSDLSETDIAEIINNSFSDPVNRIFFDDKVIIEDDVDPASGPLKKKDFEVSKYLRTFDLMYTKSVESSVTFSNISTSNLKKKAFFYVNVYFDSYFTNPPRNLQIAYQPRKRVAMVRADKQDKKWKTYLVGIRFYSPEDEKKANLNDIQFAKDASATTTKLRSRETKKVTEADLRATYEQERAARDKEYNQALALARAAEAKQDYPLALDNYKIAREISQRLEVIKKVIELEHIIQKQNNWPMLREQGDLAAKRGDYSKAMDFYNQVLRLKPDQTDLLGKIKDLSHRIELVSLIKNLYEQGKYDEALKECSRRIKKMADPSTASELFLLRGRCYVALGKLKNASEEYDAVIRNAPDFLEARIARADLFEKKSEWASAIAEYDVILQSIAPKDPQFFAKKADLQLKAKNIQAALSDYEKAIQLNPSNPRYYFEQGMLYMTQGNTDKAKISFDNAIRVGPTFVDAYYQRSKLQLQLNHLKEAAEDLEKSRQMGLGKASLDEINQISQQNYRNGLARFEQKQYDEAIQQFDQALLIKPDYTEAWFAKGEVYFQRKSFAAARDSYSQAIIHQPTHAEAYCRRGLAETQLEEYTAALKDFDKAVALKPDYADAQLGSARTYLTLKKYSEATIAFQQVISVLQKQAKSAPKKAQATFEDKITESFLLLGRCQYETKNYQTSIESFDKALDYNKSLSQAYYNRGMAYYELNNKSRAIENFSICLDKNPEWSDAWYARAKAYEFSEKYEKAIADYTQVLNRKEVAIGKEALYRRGVSYAKQKKYEDALKDYEAYLRKYPKEFKSMMNAEMGFLYLDTQWASQAFDKFKAAYQSDVLNPTALYGLAFSLAQLSKASQSVEWLEKALKVDANEWKTLKKDSYLTNLKSNPVFQKLKKEYNLK